MVKQKSYSYRTTDRMKRQARYQVNFVDAADVRPLRQRVLRPHQNADDLVYPGDDHPDSRHFAAVLDGRIVAIASLYRMDHESRPVGPWRLRGMASSDEARGRGAGGAVLRAVLAHAARSEPSAIWCNARIAACPFYEHFGFQAVGDVFDIEGIGPHYLMTRSLSASDADSWPSQPDRPRDA